MNHKISKREITLAGIWLLVNYGYVHQIPLYLNQVAVGSTLIKELSYNLIKKENNPEITVWLRFLFLFLNIQMSDVFECNLYIQDPHKAVVQVGVHGLHVIQCDWLPEQLLVERQSEATIYVVAVEHCHAHNATHKVEVWQVLLYWVKGLGRTPDILKLKKLVLKPI